MTNTPNTEMVERVARAMFAGVAKARDFDFTWDSMVDYEPAKRDYFHAAKAAIAEVFSVLMECDREVIDVGRDVGPAAPYGLHETREKWQAMLQQARYESLGHE